MNDDNEAPQEATQEEQVIGLPVLHMAVAGVLGVAIILLLVLGGKEEEQAEEVASAEVVLAEGEKQVQLKLDLERSQSGVDSNDIGTSGTSTGSGESGSSSGKEDNSSAEQAGERAKDGQEAGEPSPAESLSVRQLENAPSGSYTLQLLAAYREGAVAEYVQQYPQVPVTYYKTTKDGFPWYVAVTGLYADRDQAQAGIASLPAEMIARNPWPKPVRQVRKELKANQ